MIFYKDMTFCNNPGCTNKDCDRKITKKVIADADLWWGGPGAPMSTADFREICDNFEMKAAEKESEL